MEARMAGRRWGTEEIEWLQEHVGADEATDEMNMNHNTVKTFLRWFVSKKNN
jgi:hypothetical protein